MRAHPANTEINTEINTETLERATFAGGCFWCTEALLAQLAGVVSVVPGYAGGTTAQPDYETVCTGTTGHAECVQLTFDPTVIDYPTLLQAFMLSHDPTTKDRQGHDVGSQYRSAIFTHDPRQAQQARAALAEFERRGLFGAPIVTEIVPLDKFWPAEAEHHDFFARAPQQRYCAFVIAPKVAVFREQFAALLHDA